MPPPPVRPRHPKKRSQPKKVNRPKADGSKLQVHIRDWGVEVTGDIGQLIRVNDGKVQICALGSPLRHVGQAEVRDSRGERKTIDDRNVE